MKELYIQASARITSDSVFVNGERIEIVQEPETNWLTNIYRSLGIQYPKFFKMDNLCKAGFLAAELIMSKTGLVREEEKRDWSVLIFNQSSSLDNDQSYQKTIQDPNNYFPSPAVFVYTLSNIVTGEIAIRNKIMGESCSYITETFDAESIISNGFIGLSEGKNIQNLLIGWVEYLNDECNVLLYQVNGRKEGSISSWSKKEIEKDFFCKFAK